MGTFVNDTDTMQKTGASNAHHIEQISNPSGDVNTGSETNEDFGFTLTKILAILVSP